VRYGLANERVGVRHSAAMIVRHQSLGNESSNQACPFELSAHGTPANADALPPTLARVLPRVRDVKGFVPAKLDSINNSLAPTGGENLRLGTNWFLFKSG
jgi:hypothetical protein